MIQLSKENKILVFKVEGYESILSMVHEVCDKETSPYKWFFSERRGNMSLIPRDKEVEGVAFLLKQQLESVFRIKLNEYLRMYNETGFSPRHNFTITRIDQWEDFGKHNDIVDGCPESYGAIFYLNDDFDGGELVFDDIDVHYKIKAGTLIIFPGHLYHSVRKVLNGQRYTAALWVEKYLDPSQAKTNELWPLPARPKK